MMWQLFDLPRAEGRCAVPAATEAEARDILARNAWNSKDPGWPHTGTLDRPRPPWADWERLERWDLRNRRPA